MARLTVKALCERVEALERQVAALEHAAKKRRIGFEYEGSVGGDMMQSTYYDAGGPGEDKNRHG